MQACDHIKNAIPAAAEKMDARKIPSLVLSNRLLSKAMFAMNNAMVKPIPASRVVGVHKWPKVSQPVRHPRPWAVQVPVMPARPQLQTVSAPVPPGYPRPVRPPGTVPLCPISFKLRVATSPNILISA
jgi:hypothetical protein